MLPVRDGADRNASDRSGVYDWREGLLAEARREAWHVLATDRQRRRSRIQSKQSAGHWQVVGNRARLRKFRSEGDSARPSDESRTREWSSIGRRNSGKNLGTDALHVLQRFLQDILVAGIELDVVGRTLRLEADDFADHDGRKNQDSLCAFLYESSKLQCIFKLPYQSPH